MTLTALLVLGAGMWLGLSQMLTRRWPWEVFGTGPSQSDIFKLAIAVVAAAGAAVALVVNYRRQRHLELDTAGRRDELRLFTERFGVAAAQLGGSEAPVRLAGVYAMAALADEWETRRQQCIDVLCGYLRLPYEGDPPPGHPDLVVEQRHFRGGEVQRTETTTYRPGEVQVRRAIIATITQHLQANAAPSWSNHSFDFTRAHLIDASFEGAVFSGEHTSFVGAKFSGEHTSFDEAVFPGAVTSFEGAVFSGTRTGFHGAKFSGQSTMFRRAVFSGEHTSFEGAVFSGTRTGFHGAKFSGQSTMFRRAVFSGRSASFPRAVFSSEATSFESAEFSGGSASFDEAVFSGENTVFLEAEFSGGSASFIGAVFSSEETLFLGAKFSGGSASFPSAVFSSEATSFESAEFSGEKTSFYKAVFSGEDTSFDGAVFSGEHTWFDEATFVRSRDGADMVTEAMAGARFEHPDRVGWGPVPPRPAPDRGPGAAGVG